MICHSGGAEGSDYAWLRGALHYGLPVHIHSFKAHEPMVRPGVKVFRYSDPKLQDHEDIMMQVSLKLGRHYPTQKPFINNLLRRNYYTVKDASQVFAVGKIEVDRFRVSGGTGWAIQMAVLQEKPIYLFDQNDFKWYSFNYQDWEFEEYPEIPKITGDFAGVGSRNIEIMSIREIYKVLKLSFGG